MKVKVLHILNHSLPQTDGYAVRSSNIIRFQREFDVEPVVLTSPAQPDYRCEVEEIDGCKHYRSCDTGLPAVPFAHQLWAIRRMSKRIDEVVGQERPAILHAHSPSLWGMATAQVAKRRSIPFIYEVRGIWEDAAVDQNKATRHSLRYRLSRALESTVVRKANHVVAIAHGLQDDLIQRGIHPNKFSIVNNGVDREYFFPRAPDGDLEAKLGLHDGPRVGYIGTLYPWEGVDDLVRATPMIRRNVPNLQVIIVGGGLLENALHSLIDRLDLSDSVKLIGNVPHSDVVAYYSIMDILVYPRRSSRNTEMVTPLKPLEAMAMGKAVIGSDVGGIRELISPGTGMLFSAGNVSNLAEKCTTLIENPILRQNLVNNAERDVVTARDWRAIAKSYSDIYANVLCCKVNQNRANGSQPVAFDEDHRAPTRATISTMS